MSTKLHAEEDRKTLAMKKQIPRAGTKIVKKSKPKLESKLYNYEAAISQPDINKFTDFGKSFENQISSGNCMSSKKKLNIRCKNESIANEINSHLKSKQIPPGDYSTSEDTENEQVNKQTNNNAAIINAEVTTLNPLKDKQKMNSPEKKLISETNNQIKPEAINELESVKKQTDVDTNNLIKTTDLRKRIGTVHPFDSKELFVRKKTTGETKNTVKLLIKFNNESNPANHSTRDSSNLLTSSGCTASHATDQKPDSPKTKMNDISQHQNMDKRENPFYESIKTTETEDETFDADIEEGPETNDITSTDETSTFEKTSRKTLRDLPKSSLSYCKSCNSRNKKAAYIDSTSSPEIGYNKARKGMNRQRRHIDDSSDEMHSSTDCNENLNNPTQSLYIVPYRCDPLLNTNSPVDQKISNSQETKFSFFSTFIDIVLWPLILFRANR